MFQLLKNLPPVTKNLLIINVMMFLLTWFFRAQGIDLISLLGAHYVNSPLFEPYQIVTHFFMHSTAIFHIFFNMFALVMFGSLLEKIWGPKRFFIFYITSAVGAFLFYNALGAYELYQIKTQLSDLGYNTVALKQYLTMGVEFTYNPRDEALLASYMSKAITPMVGASGAVFGVMAAFAYLFPNTELMLMFIPFPIKAKFLIGGYFLLELYLSFQNSAGDSVAHLAHVGGAVVGFIFVFIWGKKNKNFY